MIWKVEYINLYLSLRNNLNSKNIDSLSASHIKKLGIMHEEKHFHYYKKKVFFQWFFENSENTLSFSRKTNKLVKKLDLNLNGVEKTKIKNIEPREFTLHRALKTIEVPYKYKPEAKFLSENAFFFYKDIRTYERSIGHFQNKYFGEIFMTNKELVFYDRNLDIIDQVVKHDEILLITLKPYCVKISLKDKNPLYLRYKDNELIFISLNRSVNIKNDIEFENNTKEDKYTTERTIESILTIK